MHPNLLDLYCDSWCDGGCVATLSWPGRGLAVVTYQNQHLVVKFKHSNLELSQMTQKHPGTRYPFISSHHTSYILHRNSPSRHHSSPYSTASTNARISPYFPKLISPVQVKVSSFKAITAGDIDIQIWRKSPLPPETANSVRKE